MAKTTETAAVQSAATKEQEVVEQEAVVATADGEKTDALAEQLGIIQPTVTTLASGLDASVAYTANSTVEVDPAQCPPTHICMFCAGGYRRIALTTGRVYVFVDGKPQYVHKEDRAEVAAQGGAEYK